MDNSRSNGIVLITDEIYIETENSNRFAIKIEPKWKIKTIKERISEIMSIPLIQQRLYMIGKRLKDGSYLYKTELKQDGVEAADYGIQRGAILLLRIMIPVCIKTLTGEIVQVTAEQFDTIQVLKQIICDNIAVPPAKLHLMLPGKELADGQNLYEIPLENTCSLSDYRIQAGTTLQLVMQILVRTLSDRMISLTVQPTDTVDSIKKEIQYQLGVPLEKQFLMFGQDLLDKDNCTLSEYDIMDGSVVDLTLKVSIVDFEVHTIGIKYKDTIKEIKSRFDRSVHSMFLDARPNNLKLLYDNKELGDHCTVLECNIQWESLIYIEKRNQTTLRPRRRYL